MSRFSSSLRAEIERSGKVLYEKYENYVSALKSLRKAPEQDLSNDFIQSGIIDKFELQFELGWKLFKALLAYEGDPVSASALREMCSKPLFNTMISWTNRCGLRMLRDRNDSAHIYDEERARRLVDAIIVDYIPEFERVNQGLVVRYGEALND